MKIQLQSIILISVFIGTSFADSLQKKAECPLHNRVLLEVDGMPGMMDVSNISMLVHITKEISGMLYGDLIKGSKKRTGRFLFNDRKYSIHTLARFERNGNSTIRAQELDGMLTVVKEEFAKVMEPFIKQGRGAKEFTLILMEEWAENHNRVGSFLLTWGKQPENGELAAFHAEINTFAMLEEFCSDLISFLDDMIKSCPKGWKQYQEFCKSHKN